MHKTYSTIYTHTDFKNQHMNLSNGATINIKQQLLPQSMLGASTRHPKYQSPLIIDFSDYTELTKFCHKLIILSFYNINIFRNLISCEVALQRLHCKKRYTINLEFN